VGLAQPQYVIDIPGGVPKALASPSDVETEGGRVRLRGRDGAWRDLLRTLLRFLMKWKPQVNGGETGFCYQ